MTKIIRAEEMKQLYLSQQDAIGVGFREACIKNINKDLQRQGECVLLIEKTTYCQKIGQERVLRICEDIAREYRENGYYARVDEYSETNRQKLCNILVFF